MTELLLRWLALDSSPVMRLFRSDRSFRVLWLMSALMLSS